MRLPKLDSMQESVQEYAKTPLHLVPGRRVARSGLLASAALIAVSAASAAVTALRERSTRS